MVPQWRFATPSCWVNFQLCGLLQFDFEGSFFLEHIIKDIFSKGTPETIFLRHFIFFI